MTDLYKIASYVPISDELAEEIRHAREEARLNREIGPRHGPWRHEVHPAWRAYLELRGHPAGPLRRAAPE